MMLRTPIGPLRPDDGRPNGPIGGPHGPNIQVQVQVQIQIQVLIQIQIQTQIQIHISDFSFRRIERSVACHQEKR